MSIQWKFFFLSSPRFNQDMSELFAAIASCGCVLTPEGRGGLELEDDGGASAVL